MNNKAVIYTRVSSDEQRKSGFSLDFQEKQASEYARKNGLEVVEVYKESYTAKKPGRPLFNEMIKLVTKQKISHIIFLKSDRASRNGVDSAQLVYMAEYLDFNIHLLQDGLILNKRSKPTDYMIFEISNCMANFYPRNLSIDVSTKMREKAEQGYYPSHAPCGYKNVRIKRRSYIQIDPEKALYIKKIFDLYATGNHSYESIAKLLRQEGFMVSKSVKVGKSNIEDILNNPIYMGDFIWNGKRYYNGKHDPIISRELFNACQQIMHGRNYPNSTKRDFVFSSLVKCSKCGCFLVGELKKNKYIYYHCTGNRGGNCKKGSYVREEVIDKAVIEVLESFRMDDEVLTMAFKCLKQSYKDKYGDNEERIKKANEEIEKNKKRLNKLFDLYLDGSVTEEIYKKKSTELENEIEEMSMCLKSYTTTGVEILKYASSMFELCKNASTIYLRGNNEKKRTLLKMLCSNFYYDGENVIITIKKAFQPLLEIASFKNGGAKVTKLELLSKIENLFTEIENPNNIILLRDLIIFQRNKNAA